MPEHDLSNIMNRYDKIGNVLEYEIGSCGHFLKRFENGISRSGKVWKGPQASNRIVTFMETGGQDVKRVSKGSIQSDTRSTIFEKRVNNFAKVGQLSEKIRTQIQKKVRTAPTND